MRNWVLLTEGLHGQSRCTASAVRALAEAGYRPAVTVSGGLSLAASSRYCLRRVPVPFSDDPAYPAAIEKELSSGRYLTVLPASDAALMALDAPVRHLLDKAECARLAAAAGIPVAPSRVFENKAALLSAAAELSYPLVVKPTIKRFAARRFDSAAQLQSLPEVSVPLLMQPWLDAGSHCVMGLTWKGRLVAAAHVAYERLWPLPCGTVTAAHTVVPDEDIEARLLRLLDGYDGIFHAEFVGPYLQDLNPRIHGSLPLAVASGVNLVGMYCDLLAGESVDTVRGKPGVNFRWLEGDFRSIWSAWRTGRMSGASALAALRPRQGTQHSYASLRDPGPMLARLRFIARGLRNRGRNAPAIEVRE